MTDVVIFDVAEIADAGPIGRPVRSRSAASDTAMKAFTTSAEELADSMRSFVESVNVMVADTAVQDSLYQLEKIEVQAQISAEGKIGFLGAGAAAKGSAGMKIVFERRR